MLGTICNVYLSIYNLYKKSFSIAKDTSKSLEASNPALSFSPDLIYIHIRGHPNGLKTDIENI